MIRKLIQDLKYPEVQNELNRDDLWKSYREGYNSALEDILEALTKEDMNYEVLFGGAAIKVTQDIMVLRQEGIIDDFSLGKEYADGVGKLHINIIRGKTKFQLDIVVGDKNIMKLRAIVQEAIRNTLVL